LPTAIAVDQNRPVRVDTAILVAVAAGSALGGVARHLCNTAVSRAFGESFPWGILIINVTGSFLIGLVATATGPDGRLLVSPVTRQFWMVGVFGGFTTFSSFSLNTLSLAQDGEWLRAGLNVGLSVVLCLVGVWLGAALGAAFNR
jgi:CrcB protein